MSRNLQFLSNDIQELEIAYKNNKSEEVSKLIKKFASAYKASIPELEVVWVDIYGWSKEPLNEADRAIHSMKAYLHGFKSDSKTDSRPLLTQNIENGSSSNSSSNVNVNISITFEEIMKDIKNNGYIGDDLRNEIIENIEELRVISEAELPKVEKWTKMKSFMNWISTQGVDVGIKLLPLILKALENPA